MEETVTRVTPRTSLRSVLCQQAVFEGGGRLELFSVPGLRRKLGLVIFEVPGFLEGERSEKNFSKSQGLGGSSEFLQVPGIRRNNYEENMKKYEGYMKKYEGNFIFSKYFFISPTYFFIIPSYFFIFSS